jgi:translocation and assembly module TamA
MVRLATVLLWSCWLLLGLRAGPLWAQAPGAGPGVAVPNAPGLASPPLPPLASPPMAAPRQLGPPRILRLEAEPAGQALEG